MGTFNSHGTVLHNLGFSGIPSEFRVREELNRDQIIRGSFKGETRPTHYDFQGKQIGMEKFGVQGGCDAVGIKLQDKPLDLG